jgi:hypothetical protein
VYPSEIGVVVARNAVCDLPRVHEQEVVVPGCQYIAGLEGIAAKLRFVVAAQLLGP